MNALPEYFDFSKNMETFAKMYPDFANNAAFKSAADFAAKCRAVGVEAMQKQVELTTTWMKDAAEDAAALMSVEAKPEAYMKKAGEVATSAFQDLPSRLFAYAEVAKKAQFDLMDTVMAAAPKVVEEAVSKSAEITEEVKKAAKKVA